MKEKIQVVSITLTCAGCPTTWVGRTTDDRPIEARYRWGFLRVSVGEPGQSMESGLEGSIVAHAQIGGKYGGLLAYEKLCEVTADLIEWPPDDGTL